MQILNLTKDEAKQFANFMGHTQKTHDEFYELPVDLYQTAKVSKLLLMMEQGSIFIRRLTLPQRKFKNTLKRPELREV
ncbi:hypothetical protein QE152_g27741 [Popillia japonica]